MEVKGEFQEVRIAVKGGFFSEVIRVQEGVHFRSLFDRQEARGCSDRVVFPDLHGAAWHTCVVNIEPFLADPNRSSLVTGMPLRF